MTPLNLALAGLFGFCAVVNVGQCVVAARAKKHTSAVLAFASALGYAGAAAAYVGIAFLSANG